MPIGVPPGIETTFVGFPNWFLEFYQLWPTLQSIPASEISKHRDRIRAVSEGKAFYFSPETMPEKFGDLSTENQRNHFASAFTQYMSSAGIGSEFFSICLIPTKDTDYRVKDTPRIACIFKRNANFGLDQAAEVGIGWNHRQRALT